MTNHSLARYRMGLQACVYAHKAEASSEEIALDWFKLPQTDKELNKEYDLLIKAGGVDY